MLNICYDYCSTTATQILDDWMSRGNVTVLIIDVEKLNIDWPAPF